MKDKTGTPEKYLVILDNSKNISKKHLETLMEHETQKEDFGRFNKQDLQQKQPLSSNRSSHIWIGMKTLILHDLKKS